MKILVAFLGIFGVFATSATAQDPEFYLVLRHYFNDQLWPHPSYLGYDPQAADTLEGVNSWFKDKGGEDHLPPFFSDNDIRFSAQIIPRDSNFGSGTRIDIRHKPDSASFQLTYELTMIVASNFQYASMIWAPSAIPSIIKNVILEPATLAPEVRLKTDMKLVSEMVFPNRDSINKYRFMLITLYYNRDHLSTVVDGKESVQTLSIVSNPASTRLSALVYLEMAQRVRLALFDITGKMVSEQSLEAAAGLNPVDIDCRQLPSGAYKLVAFADRKAYSQTVIVQR